jgi:hypothetical protein
VRNSETWAAFSPTEPPTLEGENDNDYNASQPTGAPQNDATFCLFQYGVFHQSDARTILAMGSDGWMTTDMGNRPTSDVRKAPSARATAESVGRA